VAASKSDEGMSIVRKLKLCKNTVRKYLRSPEPSQFKACQYKKILNQYEDKVKEMLQKRYIGTRIYSELLGIGYEGSLLTVGTCLVYSI